MNETTDKKAAQLWQELEIVGTAWQKRLGTGSMVIPLYELRRHWTKLQAIYGDSEPALEKQTREFEVARLRVEVDWLRKSLAHAVAHAPRGAPEREHARAKQSKENTM